MKKQKKTNQEWRLGQMIGDCENKEITQLKFNREGNRFSVGDKNGRIIIFKRKLIKSKTSLKTKIQFDYETEFQSHIEEFNIQNSQSVSESIKDIEWLPGNSKFQMLLSCNEKSVKLWKFGSQVIREVEPYKKIKNIRPSNFKKPQLLIKELKTVVDLKRQFNNFTKLHLNSLSLNLNERTFLVSDQQFVYHWDLEQNKQTYRMLDTRQLEEINSQEVILKSKFFPHNDFQYFCSTSDGKCMGFDMRENLCNKKSSIKFEVGCNYGIFNDILREISDFQFSNCEKFVYTRDLLSVNVWDLKKTDQPLRTIPLFNPIKQKMTSIYDDFMDDQNYQGFNLSLSQDSTFMATGGFDSRFNIIDMKRFNNYQCQYDVRKRVKMILIDNEYRENLGKNFDVNKRIYHSVFSPIDDVCLTVQNSINVFLLEQLILQCMNQSLYEKAQSHRYALRKQKFNDMFKIHRQRFMSKAKKQKMSMDQENKLRKEYKFMEMSLMNYVSEGNIKKIYSLVNRIKSEIGELSPESYELDLLMETNISQLLSNFVRKMETLSHHTQLLSDVFYILGNLAASELNYILIQNCGILSLYENYLEVNDSFVTYNILWGVCNLCDGGKILEEIQERPIFNLIVRAYQKHIENRDFQELFAWFFSILFDFYNKLRDDVQNFMWNSLEQCINQELIDSGQNYHVLQGLVLFLQNNDSNQRVSYLSRYLPLINQSIFSKEKNMKKLTLNLLFYISKYEQYYEVFSENILLFIQDCFYRNEPNQIYFAIKILKNLFQKQEIILYFYSETFFIQLIATIQDMFNYQIMGECLQLFLILIQNCNDFVLKNLLMTQSFLSFLLELKCFQQMQKESLELIYYGIEMSHQFFFNQELLETLYNKNFLGILKAKTLEENQQYFKEIENFFNQFLKIYAQIN